jgi:hypothetical protein
MPGMVSRKNRGTSLSLKPEIVQKLRERSALFKMNLTRYVTHLIESDYESASTKIVIVAEPQPRTTLGAGYSDTEQEREQP